MKHNQIIFRNTKLSYYTFGSGKPLLLMHGFAEDHSIWQHQIEHLSKNYLVIAPDLFGAGNSEYLNDENVSIESYAQAIKEIIKAEKIDRFIMIGHSMGGYISLAYLRLYPDDLAGIGFVHSTIFADDDQKVETRKKSIAFIKSHGGAAFLKTSIPGLYFDVKKFEKDINSQIEKSLQIKDQCLIQYYKAMLERPDGSDLIKKTNIPILLIAGKHDQAVTFSQSLKQFHLGKITYLKVLQNSAHMGMIEEPESITQFLTFFVENQSGY
jgi:pimeloyl-ACP methyl ester carboxylesterase